MERQTQLVVQYTFVADTLPINNFLNQRVAVSRSLAGPIDSLVLCKRVPELYGY